MEILTALSQHGHFKRAADACGISQPAFSTRLSNLEKKLGAQLVKRGNRYVGLTAAGEIALLWARRILQNAEAMRQDITATRDGLNGRVAIGVVPTAVAYVSRVSILLRKAHPGLTVEIRSASSDQIQRELASQALDIGVTYANRISGSGYQVEHLYDEKYVFVASETLVDPATEAISWVEAANLPLCLLSTDMNNRRIIDRVFASVDATPIIALETNAFTAALVQVSAGLAGTVSPMHLVENIYLPPHLLVLPLVEPVISEPIGFATVARETTLPTIKESLLACREALR